MESLEQYGDAVNFNVILYYANVIYDLISYTILRISIGW
jgi:hypothetical protein